MKHILNDLSNEEKNSIREQHTGGMKVMTESFSRLLNAKLGDAKPFVNEQAETKEEDMDELIDVDVEVEYPECWEQTTSSDGKRKKRRKKNSSCSHKYKTKGPKTSYYGRSTPGM